MEPTDQWCKFLEGERIPPIRHQTPEMRIKTLLPSWKLWLRFRSCKIFQDPSFFIDPFLPKPLKKQTFAENSSSSDPTISYMFEVRKKNGWGMKSHGNDWKPNPVPTQPRTKTRLTTWLGRGCEPRWLRTGRWVFNISLGSCRHVTESKVAALTSWFSSSLPDGSCFLLCASDAVDTSHCFIETALKKMWHFTRARTCQRSIYQNVQIRVFIYLKIRGASKSSISFFSW